MQADLFCAPEGNIPDWQLATGDPQTGDSRLATGRSASTLETLHWCLRHGGGYNWESHSHVEGELCPISFAKLLNEIRSYFLAWNYFLLASLSYLTELFPISFAALRNEYRGYFLLASLNHLMNELFMFPWILFQRG